MPSSENTIAAVILYKPEGDLQARIDRVLSQVEHLVVVANDGETVHRIPAFDSARVTYLQNSGNLGLGYALNQSLKFAAAGEWVWCLLLDQDTLIDEDLISGLATVYTLYPQPWMLGLLAPNYRSHGGARVAYPIDKPWQLIDTAVTSGSLLPLPILQQVGAMREEFFIEGIDIEFSLRLRAAGFLLVASGRPLMTHGAGESEERRIFHRTVLVGHHPPWRCFLQFRNLTWILWRYRKQEPAWVRRTLRSILKRYCIVILFEHQRMQKLLAMLRGTCVGFVQALRTVEAPAKDPILERRKS